MESEILERLKAQEAKLDAIQKIVDKTRRYYLITMWITIILFVLPLIGLVFAVPAFINLYLGSMGSI